MTAAYNAYCNYRDMASLSYVSDRHKARLRAEHAWVVPLVERLNGTFVRFSAHDRMFDALKALRRICHEHTSQQYLDDMQAVARAQYEVDVVNSMLEASGFDSDDIADWFDAAYERGFVCTEDGYFADKDACRYCEHSGAWYLHESMATVIVGGNRRIGYRSETWSSSARDDDAFFCDVSCDWFSLHNFSSSETDNGYVCCEEHVRELGWYYDEYSERWSEYAPDDEDEDEETDIPHYHGARRKWSLEIARRSQRAFYGFEIEIEFNGSYEREEFYANMKFPTDDYCAELDGSLSDDSGLEVITRPFPLQELQQSGNLLQRLLESMEAEGAYAPDYKYGIHITFNAQRLASDHRRRLFDMVYDMPRMTNLVSGRNETEYASVWNKHSGGKYTALRERDDGSYEMRTFKSTTDWDTLMSYVEYIEALTEWTRNPNFPVRGPVAQAMFRGWIASHADFPHLAARFPTPTAKDIQCALPSSNRPVEVSLKPRYDSASSQTQTEPVSPQSSMQEFLETRIAELLYGRVSSPSTSSSTLIAPTMWMNDPR